MKHETTARDAILVLLGDSEKTFNTVISENNTPHKYHALRNGMLQLMERGLVEKVWRGSVHEPCYRRKR